MVGALDRLGDVHEATTPRSSRATRPGTRSRCPRATATPGPTRPTCASRRSSRGCRPSRRAVEPIEGARVLAVLGDSITTDHISPAGAIKKDSPAGQWLIEQRRRAGRLQLLRLAPRQPRGDDPRHLRQHPPAEPAGREARRLHPHFPRRRGDDDLRRGDGLRRGGVPLVVLAGKEYGSGSSRDWAAKGTNLLGVRAVIAESFERIHRSNLIGMGVLPLQFPDGESGRVARPDRRGAVRRRRPRERRGEEGRGEGEPRRAATRSPSRPRSASTPRTRCATSSTAASSSTCCGS